MPKYLVNALYSTESFRGLMKESAASRKATISRLYRSMGGKVESMYFTEEDCGIVMIVDLPDGASGAAVTIAVSATGALAKLKITQLYAVDEIDKAMKKAVAYRPPGK